MKLLFVVFILSLTFSVFSQTDTSHKNVSVPDTAYKFIFDELSKHHSYAEKEELTKYWKNRGDARFEFVPFPIIQNIFWQNPAYTGCEYWSTLNTSYYVDKPLMNLQGGYLPQTFTTAFDGAFGKKKNLGLGIHYYNKIGNFGKEQGGYISFAHRINLGEYHKLRLGFAIGYFYKLLDFESLSFPDMTDPTLGFVNKTMEKKPKMEIGAPDFSLGLWYSYKNFYYGASFLHPTQPSIAYISFARVPAVFLMQSGYYFHANKDLILIPALAFKDEEDEINLTPNLSAIYKNKYLLNVEYKNLNTASLHVGLIIKDCVIFNIGFGIPANYPVYNMSKIGYAETSIRFQYGRLLKTKYTIIK